MSSSEEPAERRLLDAVIFWGDDCLLAAVAKAEAIFADSDLRGMGHPRLGRVRGDAEAEYLEQSEWIQARIEVSHVWKALLEDFRWRIQSGHVFLSGLQTRPEMQQLRVPIPSLWASDFEFDFFKDQVTVGDKHRFIGVIASRIPPGKPSETAPTNCVPATTLTPGTVQDLSDEVILTLLNEHAKRVVENDAKLVAPGKISLVPIIRRKMLHRADMKQLESTLAAEMVWLETWIGSKVVGHQIPTAKSLANSLRSDYAACKARSNSMKA